MTKLISNILILLVSILASLGAAELVLRTMTGDKSLAVGTTRTTKAKWYGWALEANTNMPFVNPDTGARSLFMTNSHGWKDVEHAQAKPPGTFRILVLGDSYTYGLVPLEELYTRQLENLLRDQGVRSVEVISMGVGGWGTDQELEALRHEGVRFAPDLVICQFCINDLDNILLPDPAIPIKETNRIYLAKPFRYELHDGRLKKIRLQPDGKGEKMTVGGWLREIFAGSALLARVEQLRSTLASKPAARLQVSDPSDDTDTDDPEGARGDVNPDRAADRAQRGDRKARANKKAGETPWWVRIPLNPAAPHFVYLVDDGRPHPHPGWPLLEALLAEMNKMTKDINARFVVFSESGDSGRRKWNLDWGRIKSDREGDFIDWRGKRYPIDVLRPLKELDKICRRQGIPLIKPVRGYPRYHNDPHTNSEGNRRMAEDIADFLIEHHLVPDAR